MKRKRTRGSSRNILNTEETDLVQEASENKGKKTKPRRSKGDVFKKLLLTIFLLFVIGTIAGTGICTGLYAAVSKELEGMDIQDLAHSNSSVIYYLDENGEYAEAITLSGNEKYGSWLDSEEIPKLMKQAIVSIEDERFYKHNGVDIKRTAGAVIEYVKAIIGRGTASYGGSTITQQVIKNVTKENDRTATRKVKEIMRAIAVEKQLSKDEIVTIYLNIIPLTHNMHGIEAGSQYYFNKPCSELTLSEMALLAGITKRPVAYDPETNPENAIKRRNTILRKMNELGYISTDEMDEAISTDIVLHKAKSHTNNQIYSYFIDTVIAEVTKDLQTELGYSKELANAKVTGGGLKIYSTMDLNVQEAMEEVYTNSGNFSGNARDAQSAMIVVDPQNGEIKGIIGGKGKKEGNCILNRATQSKRQPGSSIKPLSVYAPAIEEGLITPKTIVQDEPITLKTVAGEWSPKNAYKGYKGNITVSKAIEISSNTAAVRVMQDLGTDASYDYLTNKFHISSLEKADKNYAPLSLGGLTSGVYPKDMAAAYSVFANGGTYYKPHSYTTVVDVTGNVILEADTKEEKVLSSGTAYTMCEMLYDVPNGSSGTARQARLDDMPTYGKTGTTNDNGDKWFVGFTPHYVGVVWFGFDQRKSITDAGISANKSQYLWKQVMEKINRGLSTQKIQPSANTVEVEVCSSSGKLPLKSCPTTTMHFEIGYEPDKYCSGRHKYKKTYSEYDYNSSKNKNDDDEERTADDDDDDSDEDDDDDDEDRKSSSSSSNEAQTGSHSSSQQKSTDSKSEASTDSDVDATIEP